MLTLITGLPGNGKTLYALQYVAAWAKKEGRQVYYHGIKDLSPDLGWKEIPVKTESMNGKDVNDERSDNVEVPQWFLLPSKSIFLIDEAQNCGFGPRMRGLPAEWARKLETHRHLGIDGVFITQEPGLIDAHDRKLCELHFHVMRTFGLQRATIHEFRPVRQNISVRKGSIQHKWAFPKEVFKWYTSAEAHTHKARIPLKVWVLLAICIGLPILIWFAWVNYLDPHRVRLGAPAAGAVGTVLGGMPAGGAGQKWVSTAEYLQGQTPRVSSLAFTAPVYDEVTKPVVAPYPAACVSTAIYADGVVAGERCKCYSQQATALQVDAKVCKDIVAGGFFVSWQQPVAMAQPLQPSEGSEVPSGGQRRETAYQAAKGVVGPSPAPSYPNGQRGKLLPQPSAAAGFPH